jgi:signal transduction histidine kinase
MGRARLVKWSKEAKEFFDKAKDNSIVLNLMISHASASQTGEGFKELVNSINSESIKRKVKKVVITDTSYLYRYTIPEFQKYSDQNIPTEWYLNNKEIIEKLTVPMELKSWANDIKSESFNKWKEQIMIEYKGNANGDGMVQDFRDLVIAEAAVAAYKSRKELKDCINFMLEECAHACATFNGTINLVSPMKISLPVINLSERYNLDINHLSYIASVQTQNSPDHISIDFVDGLDKEISVFMKEKVSNVNFFVIDKNGNHIYKNSVYDKRIGDVNFARLDPVSWKNSINVMNKREQMIVEEEYMGNVYLTVKAPLVINGQVKGVIGLAVDITDRKKAEKLEKELYEVAKKVAHDISSPIASLDIFKYLYAKQLPHDQKEILELIIKGIKNITQTLLSKYKSVQNKEKFEVKKICEDYIAPYTINEIIERKRHEYYNKELQIKYNPDKSNKFVFIRGDFSNFLRMMTNLINNAENAVEEKGKEGIVEVSYKVIGKEVDIRVTDNGIGMPKEMVEKINNGMTVGTTKEDGHGIGMEQILNTVEEMKCKMEVKSKEGKGTEFKLICDICEPPKWFVEKIEIRKGSAVVVLDDDVVIHDIWKKKLKEYEKDIEVKYFRKGSGAIKYINSIKEKKKVLLLTDYELGDEEELINGINVIEKTNLKDSHVLVTSSYLSEIKEFEEKSDFLKICPKTYLNDITLVLAR